MMMLPLGQPILLYGLRGEIGSTTIIGDIIIKSALVAIKSKTPVHLGCRIRWYDVHMFLGLIVHCI